MRRCLRDPTFSRFDTIPECDGHTDTQTDRHTDTRRRHIPRLARRRAVKMNDTVQEITCTTFISPMSTCWSSKFSAGQRVVSTGLEKLKLCHVALKQKPKTDANMLFLAPYANTIKPIPLTMTLL